MLCICDALRCSVALIEPLLARGAIPGKTLGPEDLYAVPENETAAALVSVFRERYDELTVEAKRAMEEAEAQRHPLGRVGNVEEVSSVIGFLASDQASFMTGQTVGIDGGRALMV